MPINWKEIARRLAKEKRGWERYADECADSANADLHRALDKAGCPKSTYYPDGKMYDGAIARVNWLVAQHQAQGDKQAVPRRDFDTALQLRDMYIRESVALRNALEAHGGGDCSCSACEPLRKYIPKTVWERALIWLTANRTAVKRTAAAKDGEK